MNLLIASVAIISQFAISHPHNDSKSHETTVCTASSQVNSGCTEELPYKLGVDMPWASKDDIILIRFSQAQKPKTPREVGFQTASFKINNEIYNSGIVNKELNNKELRINLYTLKKVRHGEIVEIIIENIDGTQERFYFRFSHPFSLYDFGGFWFPLGSFSTNFNKNGDEGIPFVPTPLSIAWGFRINMGKNNRFYTGFSMMISWLIHEGDSNDFLFQSASAGVTMDIGNYLYVGYAYGLDFSNTSNSPGHMLVIGIGPQLLMLMKSKISG